MSRRIRRSGVSPTGDGDTINMPPYITDPVLMTSDVTASSFVVTFARATDDISAPENLVYKLYKSDIKNLDTVENILANGTLVGQVTGIDAPSYSIQIKDLPLDTTVYFNVVVTDEAGNSNPYDQSYETTIAIDDIQPTVTLASSTSKQTNTSPIPVSVTFSEVVTGLAIDDFSVTGATKQNYVNVDGKNYSLELVPTADGIVTIQLPAGMAQDISGNVNLASNVLSREYDSVSPTPVITSTTGDPTATNPIPFEVNFGEHVQDFELSSMVVSGGVASNLILDTGDVDEDPVPGLYTFEVTPNSDFEVITINIPTDAVKDFAGNGNNEASLTISYSSLSPVPTVTSTETSPTTVSPIPITITFNKNVIGFEQSDISILNATISNFIAVSAQQYTFDATPSSDPVTVSIQVPENVCSDDTEDENLNVSSEVLEIVYESVPAKGVITSTANDPTTVSPIPISVDFGKTVTGFTSSDIVVVGATVSNFINRNGQNYTFNLVPDSDIENITVDIPAGVCTGLVSGQDNVASDQFTITYDVDRPLAVITSDDGNPTNTSPFGVTITFQDDVDDLVLGDLVINNGSGSNFLHPSGKVYTLDITPVADGNVSINIPEGVCSDSAGNTNIDVSAIIVYDSTAPTLSSSTLSATEVSTGAFDVSYTKAADGETAVSDLIYSLYTSLSNNITTVADTEANGTFQDIGTDVSKLNANGFSEGDVVYFQVIVRDEAGNKAAYTSNSITISDTTAPNVGSPTISTLSIKSSSFEVSVVKATDNVSAQSALTYYLYGSESDNLGSTVSTVEANGTLFDSGVNKNTLSASGLNSGQAYYINVVVEDEAGNKALYNQKLISTTSESVIESVDFDLVETDPLAGDISIEENQESTPTDTESPVLSDTTLTASNITQSGATVNYTKATDETSPQSALIYILYKSDSGNISTVADAEANGEQVVQIVDTDNLSISGLSASQTVWLNVVVVDEAGNKRSYDQISVTTLAETSGLDSQAGDEQALESLYSSTTGGGWTNQTGWSSNMSLSNTIYGVQTETIGGELRVTRVDLYNNNLAGTLPAELGNLKKCKYFNVKFNKLTGEIPSEIGDMIGLEFLILSGRTYEIGGFTKEPPTLVDIEKGYAYHPGKRRSSTNAFSGLIPSSIGNLSNLLYLEIADNIDIKGPIPNSIGNLSKLYGLALSQNDFSGTTIPSSIGNLTELRHLYITDAQLDGEIPSSLKNLTKLTSISLGKMKNTLPGNNLTGDFPDFSNTYQLYDVWMSNCGLTGEYPQYWNNGNFTKLRHLQFAWNNLTGTLHSFENLQALEQFAVSGNQLSGEVATQLLTLHPRLQILSIGWNNFTGGIPQSGWPDFYNMKTLYMNQNGFTGGIPCDFWNKVDNPKLNICWLSNCEFSSNCTEAMNNVTGDGSVDIAVGGNNF